MLDALMRTAEGDDGGSMTTSRWKVRLFHLSLHPGAVDQLAVVVPRQLLDAARDEQASLGSARSPRQMFVICRLGNAGQH